MADEEITKAVEEAGEIDMGLSPENSPQKGDTQTDSPPVEESETEVPAAEGESSEAEDSGEAEPQRDKNKERWEALTDSNRKLNRSVREQEGRYNQLVGEIRAMQTSQQVPAQTGPGLSHEQEIAKRQLSDTLEVTGMSQKMKALSDKVEGLIKEQQGFKFDQEDKDLETLVTKMGLLEPGEDYRNDFLDRLKRHIDDTPFLREKERRPGVYLAALKDIYFDKGSDMAKRAASKQIVEDQEKAKAANLERGTRPTAKKGKRTGNIFSETARVMEELGEVEM